MQETMSPQWDNDSKDLKKMLLTKKVYMNNDEYSNGKEQPFIIQGILFCLDIIKRKLNINDFIINNK